MDNGEELLAWTEKIRQRYENYLRTSFFFREPGLRASFRDALQGEEELMKGPFEETGRAFARGTTAKGLARESFPDGCGGLEPALLDRSLYTHQERAIRMMFQEERNVVVATGTASGKTEGFLYPILFELYRQHLRGELVASSIKTFTFHAMSKSKLRHRSCTGASFISAMPWRMRDFSSAMDATRMWRRNVRAILEKAHSMRFSQEPCFGVCTYSKRPGRERQVRHGLAGNVRGVIVEDNADDGVGRIVTMQALQQGDELAATMSRLDIGDDFAAVQIQRGENRQRAVAHVFVVARQRRLLPRYRRQVRKRWCR